MSLQWSPAEAAFLGLVVVLIMSLGIAGNILVVLVLRTQSTRRISGRQFLANLAIADIGGSANLLFMLVTIGARGEWIFGRELCQFNGMLAIFFASASMWTLSAISFNRYVKIVHHASYTRIFTVKTTALGLALTWLLPLVMSLAPVLGWSSHRFQFGKCSCHFYFSESLSYTLTFMVLIVVVPFKVILFSYYKIYQTTKHHKTTLEKRRASHPCAVNSEDIKITKTIFIIILVYMICFLPGSVVNIVEMTGKDLHIPPWLDISSFLLVVSNHANNPLIYGLGNRSLRKAFWSVLSARFRRRRADFSATAEASKWSEKTGKQSDSGKGDSL